VPKLRQSRRSPQTGRPDVGPVLSWTTEQHAGARPAVPALPGARLLFGGKALTGHTIPERYGAMQPTAVQVPLACPVGRTF
jgi:1-pyrroline-5-carboxylate dehydrogenase